MEVVVIGIGRIGAVAACCLADAGHWVTGQGKGLLEAVLMKIHMPAIIWMVAGLNYD